MHRFCYSKDVSSFRQNALDGADKTRKNQCGQNGEKGIIPVAATSQSALELAFGGLVPGVCELAVLELIDGRVPGTFTGAVATESATVGG